MENDFDEIDRLGVVKAEANFVGVVNRRNYDFVSPSRHSANT